VEGYSYLCVLKKLDNSSYFFIAVCEGDSFCFLVLGGSVCFCLCDGECFPIRLVLYSLLYSMFLMVFVSVSFAFLFVGYVCSLFNR
jgi:hypothetical protein